MLRKQRQGGYLLVRNADGKGRDVESDTFSCRHCNRVVKVPPGADPASLGRWCSSCDGLLCAGCSSHLGCAHVERRMDMIERRARIVAAVR